MTHQAGSGQPDILQMQPDGNLVLYAPFSYVAPKATANGQPSNMQTSSLMSSNQAERQRVVVWSSGTASFVYAVKSGANLKEETSIWSPNREARFTLENTGQAVIYRNCDGAVVWSTHLRERHFGKNVLQMQPDGNAVIYETGVEHAAPLGKSEQDLVVWSTDTHATTEELRTDPETLLLI